MDKDEKSVEKTKKQVKRAGRAHRMTEEQHALARKLTHLNRLLIINMVKGLNSHDAYRAAGGKGSKKSVIDTAVSRIMGTPKARAFYDSLMESAAAGAVLSRAEALEILSNQARTNIADIAEFSEHKVGEKKDGTPAVQTVWKLRDSADMEPEQLAAICEVKASKDGLTIKLHDQKAAIKQISDLMGWAAPEKKSVALTGEGGGPVKTEEVGGDGVARKIAFLLARGLSESDKKQGK